MPSPHITLHWTPDRARGRRRGRDLAPRRDRRRSAIECRARGAARATSQNVATRSLSANSIATSGGVTQLPLTFTKSSSVAPRATAQPFQTKTGTA